MNIVAMYRVKNEARWIRESILRTLEVANMAVILDDESTDGTAEVAASAAESVMVYEKSKASTLDWGKDEARDREFLMKKAVEFDAQWVMSIDGDEVLTPSAIEACKRILAAGKRGAYFFRVAYLWDAPDIERFDGVYGKIMAPILFTVHGKEPDALAYRHTQHGANMHCGRLPHRYYLPSYHILDEMATVKHYGYMLPEDRERKHAFYVEQDTPEGLVREGHYDHILGKPTHWAPGPVALRTFLDK